MNYKSLIVIALAICMCIAVAPVTAVWDNGNWIKESELDGYTVVHDPVTGTDSKYKPTDAFGSRNTIDNLTGTLSGHVKSGFNTLTSQIGVRNINSGPNGTFTFTPIKPDGTFEDQYVPGRYELCLFNAKGEQYGNGGQPECTFFNIALGNNLPSYPEKELLGQAVSSEDDDHNIVYTITKATYGATREDCFDATWSDWSRHHPESQHQTRTVVDHAAWDEQSHYQITDSRDFGNRWYHDYKVKCTNHAEHGDGWHYQSGKCTEVYVIHHVAETHQEYRYITNQAYCSTYGQNLDVTRNVQEAVDKGYLKFLFDNSAPHVGIYDITTSILLSEIEDPAVGIVKNVYIEYTVDGAERTIYTMEYEIITI